jgi:hypothetical protein
MNINFGMLKQVFNKTVHHEREVTIICLTVDAVPPVAPSVRRPRSVHYQLAHQTTLLLLLS